MDSINLNILELIQNYDTEQLTQEKKLLFAILDIAVRDIVKYNQRPNEKKRIKMEEACEWFEDDQTDPFTFLWIMEVIGAEPRGFLKRLAVFVKTKKRYGRKKDL